MADTSMDEDQIDIALAEFAIELIESQVCDCDWTCDIEEDDIFEAYI